MIHRWERGRAEVDELLAQTRLTRVAANRQPADQHILQAAAHLQSARSVVTFDAPGAFVLAYDAARLSLAAILINQGLRARGEGAHAVLLEAILAQTEPPKQNEFREFDWMRRLRNDTQYPSDDRPVASQDDVEQAVEAAVQIIDRARRLLNIMPPY